MTVRLSRRTALLSGIALALAPIAAPAASESLSLTRDGQSHPLTIAPETRGYRTSWDPDNGGYRFNIDAEGPDGTYSVSGSYRDGEAVDGLMFVPGLPGLGNAPGVELHLSRVLLRGSNLRLRGWAGSDVAGIRIDFDVTLTPLNFAPTPGPTPGPLD